MIRPPPISTLFPYTTLFRSIVVGHGEHGELGPRSADRWALDVGHAEDIAGGGGIGLDGRDRKSTRLKSSHQIISYAVFCLKKKKTCDLAANQLCRPRRY